LIKINHIAEHTHFKQWPEEEFTFVKPENVQAFSNLNQVGNDQAEFLMKSYQELMSGDQNPRKLAVVCKSGVGRTGTLMGLINILITLKSQDGLDEKDKKISVFSIVRRLREQRFELVKNRS